MSQFWSPFVRSLVPYTPGEQPKLTKLTKLNTNENPYGPSPKAIAAMQAAVNDDLRLYPDPNCDQLKNAVAEYYGLERSQVFVGNSSDEVLAHAFCAFFQHDKPLLFPDITYSFYPVYCGLYGIEPKIIPLDESFAINLSEYEQENSGIIFPNPNAPTGRLLPLEAIEALLKKNTDTVVLVDEAYIDFGGETAVKLINQFPNLLVVQTLSKSRSLAGLRVGAAMGNPELIEGLERVKNSFNSYPLDRVALAGASAAFADKEYFEACCAKVIATREVLTQGLESLGFEVLPSAANFVFTRHAQHDASELALQLRQEGIIVRHFKQERIEQFLRISVGTDEEIALLLNELKKLVS